MNICEQALEFPLSIFFVKTKSDLLDAEFMMIRAFTAYAVRMVLRRKKTVIQTKYIPANPVSNFSDETLFKLIKEIV